MNTIAHTSVAVKDINCINIRYREAFYIIVMNNVNTDSGHFVAFVIIVKNLDFNFNLISIKNPSAFDINFN
jgi:hypothetical protein